MRTGIRWKLILSFVLIILIPLAVTAGSLSYVSYQFEESGAARQLENIQYTSVQVLNLTTDAFPYIEDYDRFLSTVEPVLSEHQLHLQVVNAASGIMLFDSRGKEYLADSGKVDLKLLESDAGINLNKFVYTVPVDLNGQTIKAVISTDPAAKSPNPVERIMFNLLLSFGAGFMTLITLIGFFTWYISRSILTPLNELNAAAENITRGNLDYEIAYRRDDELGRFCHTFNVMREKLKQSLTEQAVAETSRKELIAGISHDLRTPIASIKGYVEGLQDGVAGNKKMFDRYLAVIKDKSEQLDRLIDDLFQFSRLELGKLEVQPKRENSRELLDSLAGKLELEFNNHPVSFRLKRPVPDVAVQVDRVRIAQVVDNLVQNAKRYAVDNDGQITLKAFLREGCLVVAVEDNGPGIAPADLSHIFELFYRGEKSRSRDYGGTGLGLAICKHIVEAHQGEIWAVSTPGQGSTFYFSVPVVTDNSAYEHV